MVGFEDDLEIGYVYAAERDKNNIELVDIVELYEHDSEHLLPFRVPQKTFLSY